MNGNTPPFAIVILKFAIRIAQSAAILLMASAALGGPITLPLPIYLENFDGAAEGGLPAGWSRTNYSTLPQSNSNLLELASTPYAGWLVVDRTRFTSNFLAYTSHQ